jgi:hypothetical protein
MQRKILGAMFFVVHGFLSFGLKQRAGCCPLAQVLRHPIPAHLWETYILVRQTAVGHHKLLEHTVRSNDNPYSSGFVIKKTANNIALDPYRAVYQGGECPLISERCH